MQRGNEAVAGVLNALQVIAPDLCDMNLCSTARSANAHDVIRTGSIDWLCRAAVMLDGESITTACAQQAYCRHTEDNVDADSGSLPQSISHRLVGGYVSTGDMGFGHG
jgi:hypothetical protein